MFARSLTSASAGQAARRALLSNPAGPSSSALRLQQLPRAEQLAQQQQVRTFVFSRLRRATSATTSSQASDSVNASDGLARAAVGQVGSNRASAASGAVAESIGSDAGAAVRSASASAVNQASAALGGGNGNGNGRGGKKKKGFFRRVRNTLLWTTVIAGGTLYYFVWESQHPPDQLPQDPSKKTIVVLGSGWGATSFLKKVNTDEFNVVCLSPTNHFTFTPLLPSVTVGTLDGRSIAQPTRHTTRFKSRHVQVYEATAEKIDPVNKTVTFEDTSPIHGSLGKQTIDYDYLVYAVGTENQTFGIEGVRKHACFLKELPDAEKIRNRLMDCVESAAIAGQSPEEVERLLHFVTVGGGPTGVEYAAELRDFVRGDLKKWYPEVADKVKVTLIEALPAILPSFSKRLVEYTMSNFQEQSIHVRTRNVVKDVDETHVHVQEPSGELVKIPYGLLVWAAGNTARPITRDLMAQLSDSQKNRRGLEVDEHLRLKGAENSIFALGDATATQYAPTAQAASQQGAYLARVFNQLGKVDALENKLEAVKSQPLTDDSRKEILQLEKQITKAAKIRPFHYTHQGSLAYIGKEQAIADVPLLGGDYASSGFVTFLFWSSAYFSMLLSIRNRALVATDWMKVAVFGRDVSRE